MTKTISNKVYKSVRNKELQEKFAYIILECMDINEVERHVKHFPYEQDFNIYQYGYLDIYDYDIYKTLYDLGLRTNAVMNYHNNINKCTLPFKYREQIRDTYRRLIRQAVLYIINNKEG